VFFDLKFTSQARQKNKNDPEREIRRHSVARAAMGDAKQ
jgi:hypothetical protein